MTTTLEAGHDLDEKVCRALGIVGTSRYGASRNGGESFWYMNDARPWVEQEIARVNRQFPDSHYAGSAVVEIVDYPSVSENIAAAWLVVERMLSRGCEVDISSDATDGTWVVGFLNDAGLKQKRAETAPLAICRAALAAVGAQ